VSGGLVSAPVYRQAVMFVLTRLVVLCVVPRR